MTIVYLISKLLTFPGAYLKAFWEHLTCRILGIPVENSGYLRFNEVCGHVEHQLTRSKAKSFLVCFLPSMLNSLFGISMFFAGFINLCLLDVRAADPATKTKLTFFVVYIILLYFGSALMCNLFPLFEDALNMWEVLYSHNGGAHIVWKIVLFAPTVIMVAGSWLERFGLTVLLTAVAIAAGIIL
jgi:hypothetical protein